MERVSHDGTIATESELAAFSGRPEDLTPSLRGVLAETAASGRVRYPWHLLHPLIHAALDETLNACASGVRSPELGLAGWGPCSAEEEGVAKHDPGSLIVGPPPPPPFYEAGNEAQARESLHKDLRLAEGPPFTIQRICELILEPHKQYSQIHKLIAALARLMRVTSALDGEPLAGPLPILGTLEVVNDNPASPYMGGPTTEILVDCVLHAPGSLDGMDRS